MKKDTALKPSDVISIIQACKQAGVTHFAWNGVSLALGPSVLEALEAKRPVAIEDPSLTRANFIRNEAELREEQLSELRLSDPEAYEELVAKGELTDVGTPDN